MDENIVTYVHLSVDKLAVGGLRSYGNALMALIIK